MRKILLGGIVFISALLLTTGCGVGNKTLSCDQSTSGVDINITSEFKNNKITSMSLKYGMDLSSYTDAQVKAIEGQDFCTSIKQAMTGMEKAFMDCKHSIENKQLSVTASIDVKKLKGFDISEKSTFEQTKKALESSSFKCEEK